MIVLLLEVKMAQTSLLQVRITEIPIPLARPAENLHGQHIAKSWDDPDSCLNKPIHVGEGYRKITREEIYDERINSLGCMKGKNNE
jgi:hypothetical protein